MEDRRTSVSCAAEQAQEQVAVDITKPANGVTKNSPVSVGAKASSTNPITGWKICVDSVVCFEDDNKKSINANISMESGTHSVLVRARDSTGAFGEEGHPDGPVK